MKKEKLAAFHRENIAQTAHELFMQRGLAATTMDAIAKKADYSKATIYTYFQSKDEIFYYNALLGWKILLEDVMRCCDEQTDVIIAYHSICSATVKLYDEYPIYFSSILKTIASDAKSREAFPILDEIFVIGEELNRLILLLLEQGERDHILRQGTANLETVVMLWSSLTGIISFASDKEEYLSAHIAKSKKAYLKGCFTLLLRSILANGKDADET